MKTSKQYLRFCGIDMGKQKHVACVIDRNGRYLLKPRTIRNNTEGFKNILNCLKKQVEQNRYWSQWRLQDTIGTVCMII